MVDRPVDLEALLAHRPFVKALARRLVRDDARAEDVVQDTYVTAMENPPRHGGAIRAWLATVVRKMAWTHNRSEARRAAREHKREQPAPVPTPDEVVARAQWHQRLVNLVMQLDEPFRSTVLLSYFEGLSSQEIAQLQGVAAGTVRTRLHRALAQLRERLDSETEGGRETWLPALTLLGWPPPWATTPPAAPTEPVTVASGSQPLWPWVAMAVGVLGLGVLVTTSMREREDVPERTSRAKEDSAGTGTPKKGATEGTDAEVGATGQEVRVLRDGRPVADAEVVVLRLQPHLWRHTPTDRWSVWSRARTDARGVARVRSVPHGHARFLAAAPGSGRGRTVAHFPHEFEESVVVALPPERTARVVVRDGNGAPVSGASVVLLDSGEQVREPASEPSISDAEGVAVVRGLAPYAAALVRATAPGFEPSRSYELDLAAVTTASVVVRLNPRTPPVEWELDPASAPANGSSIVLRRRNEEFPIGTARIERGRLVAEGIDGWMPSMLAVAPDGRIADLDDVAPLGEAASIERVAFRERSVLDVIVRDSDGPCRGVEVRLFDAATGSPCHPDARSDGEGRARLTLHGSEPVRVGWRGAGGREFRIAGVWSPGKPRVVQMTIPSRRNLLLRFAQPLPERFEVYREEHRLPPSAFELTSNRRELAIDWRARSDGKPTSWSLLTPGFAPWNVALPGDGAAKQRIDVELAATGGLVLALSRRAGQPYSLELVPEDDEVRRGPFAFRLYPGPDHVVRETMLPPGRYRVRDRTRDVMTPTFEVRSDQRTELWFELRTRSDGPVTIAGRVVGFRDIDLTQAQVLVRASDGSWRAAVSVAADGSFSLPWPDDEAGLLLVPMHPDARDSDAIRLDGPRAYLELPLRPATRTSFVVEPRPDDGPVRVRAGRHDLPAGIRDGVLHVGGFRFPAPQTWIDIPGFAPQTLPAGALSGGGRLDLSRGTTLRVTVQLRAGVLTPELRISARSTDGERRYSRTARTKGAEQTRVLGLGKGTFEVTVWNENTGQVVWSETIDVSGTGERGVTIDLR